MTKTTEIEFLRDEADQLNIHYHPNISAEKLALRIEEYKKQQSIEKDTKTEPVKINKSLEKAATRINNLSEAQVKQIERENHRKEAAKLVRVRITCMDPNKKDYEGEILTVSNSVCGTHRKYIPYDGRDWHVPQIILNMMKEKQCQIFQTITDQKGNKSRKGKLIKAYAIEELDKLTDEELKELADLQAKTGTVD